MDSLFSLSMPWWQFVLRGAIAYAGLLVLLRMAGKRSFGDMSPFDIVVLILVGGSLRSAIVGDDTSVLGPFIAVITIIGLDKLLGWMCARSARFNRFVEGVPVLLARRGAMLDGALRKHDVPPADFERALRVEGVRTLADVAEARLEPNGKITVLKVGGGH